VTTGPWSDLELAEVLEDGNVIPYLYKRLRALGVNHSAAVKIADPTVGMTLPYIAPLAGGASAATIVTTVNELLAAMVAAGAMEEE
jgi:gentisate 1,2-dioxygenase